MRGVTIRRVSVALPGPCLLVLLAAACSSGTTATSTVADSIAAAGVPVTSVVVLPPPATSTLHAAAPQPKPKKQQRRARRASSVAGVPTVDLPDARLTPGAAFAGVTAARVCTPGYASSVRNVPAAEKEQVYAEYHVVHVPRAHEVDHLISLELGGSNNLRNLWPEPYAGRWNARVKDRLENLLHLRVCAGAMALRTAQRLISRDWPAAYRHFIGVPAADAAAAVPPAPSTSTGGYYTSAYPTASTVYCADDPAWRRLSRTYLRHFATLAMALAAFPGRHLHRPC
jgi:hypothetical protein